MFGDGLVTEKEIRGYGQLAFLYFLSQDEPYKSFGTPWPCSWQALLLKAGAHLMICVGHATAPRTHYVLPDMASFAFVSIAVQRVISADAIVLTSVY